MSTPNEPQISSIDRSMWANIARRIVQIVVVFIIQGVLLFWGAGRFDWMWAWVYFGISFASIFVNSVFLVRRNLGTIAERGRPKEMKGWDKIISALYGISLFLLVPFLAGLDERFVWSGGMATTVHFVAALVLAGGLGLGGWAMITNAWFSTVVRIQTERGHKVCEDGPYRYVRHPGYVGFVLQSLATPLLLGSWWAFPAGIVAAASLVVRTRWEDLTLQNELPGYAEYVQKVRYRLIPGLW